MFAIVVTLWCCNLGDAKWENREKASRFWDNELGALYLSLFPQTHNPEATHRTDIILERYSCSLERYVWKYNKRYYVYYIWHKQLNRRFSDIDLCLWFQNFDNLKHRQQFDQDYEYQSFVHPTFSVNDEAAVKVWQSKKFKPPILK